MNDEWNGPNGQSCKNCLFWIDTACRRYPPVLINTSVTVHRDPDGDMTLAARFEAEVPDTASDCWCGEWKGRG